MANTAYTNSVPLGEAGTGAAFILPQSQAINSLNQYIDQNAQDKVTAQRQAALQAQQVAKSWQDNQLKIKGGTLWQPEINQRAKDVMDLGMFLQKNNVNPNLVSNDPELEKRRQYYQDQKASLLRDVDVRDQLTKQSQQYEQELGKQDAGYYDPQSVQQYHDFIGGKIPLSQISGQGLQMPVLQRQFNLQPIVDKIPGVPIKTTGTNPHTGVKTTMILPNEGAHTEIAQNLVNNNPEVQADISKKAGMPFSQIGNTTDVDAIKKNLDDYWKSNPNIPSLVKMGITSYQNPAYGQMINDQAKKIATAAKVKQDYIGGIKTNLDNKVHQQDDQSWDFAYQREMRDRAQFGMTADRFNDWKKKQQNEEGNFTLGNQNSYVPVIKANVSKTTGVPGQSFVEPEKGASLFGVNLPQVETVVKPALVTDMKTGRTIKNTEPMDVKVSQIQMIPVFKNLQNNDPRNGSEISARQLREIATGKHNFATLNNITFQPYVYGLQSIKTKDAAGNMTHNGSKPVKFSYDALKGSNVKKINTAKFDQATQQLNEAIGSDQFKSLSPADRYEWLKQTFNIQEE